jgi:glycosyltransferase involved in cell wall biosynthesis
LFVSPYYKPYLGGIERVIERLAAESQLRRGVEAIGILTTNVYFPDRVMRGLPAHEVIDGVEVFRCTFRPSSLPNIFHSALAGYFSPGVARVIRDFKPDIIHYTYSEWWGANLTTYLVSCRTAHVLSTSFHELPNTNSTRPRFAVNRWLVPRMDVVQVQSDFERQQVRRAYRAPLERTVVIPPGVDMPDHTLDRAQRDSVTILAVGRLNAHKGQVQLVQMVQSLVMHEPDPLSRRRRACLS